VATAGTQATVTLTTKALALSTPTSNVRGLIPSRLPIMKSFR
jgi:hypothetical protein